MHERLATLRWVGILLCAAMLCFAPVFASGTELTNPANGSALTAGGSAGDTNLFSRTVVWWPYTTGPHYGEVRRGESRDTNVLHLNVGSFRLGETLAIPAELTNGLSFQGGSQQYFLAQLRPSALNGPFAGTLASQGAVIVARMPVNALVLRMDQAAYQLVSSSPVLQYLEPFHAAYKLSTHIGRAPQATPEAAASAHFNLLLNLFAGEPVGPTAEAIRAIGGSVRNAVDGHGTVPGQVWATVHASKIPELARLESVYSITEESPTRLHSDGALSLQSQGALFGDFPYWKAGIDGDDVLIHVTDTGMSVDAYDFADTSSVSGWAGGTCHVVANHRKVTCYQSASAVGGSGDLSSCDSADSAGPGANGTHGQIVSGVALGNGTRGEVPTSGFPSPVDMGASDYWGGLTPPVFGDGHFDDIDNNGVFSELVDTAYDGIAKGARLIFYDAYAGCSEEGGVGAGSSVSNLTVPWTQHGCFIHNASYGSDVAEDQDPDYNAASAFDAEIFSNPVHVSVRSAGNAGGRSTSGTSADPGNISNDSSCHNCIVVGASGGVGGGVYSFSSEGPAGSTRERVAPLLMAEGFDYACRSEEGIGNGEDQEGAATCWNQAAQGTSFSSPNVAGAAALMVEYFQKGMYPSGSYRAEDETTMISSALVKALMIAGTRAMAPEARGIADGRFNNVWGYGQLFLPRTLPLADSPEQTVSGLIVHDLPGDLDGDGTEDGASHLTLPALFPTAANHTEVAEFEVLADDEDLGLALVWHDDSGVDAINNDLDLELRYCGAGNCSDGDERLYRGNAFSEFPTRDPTANHDLDGDNAPTGWNYTISEDFVNAAGENYDTWQDRWNNTEAIFIPAELNRPNPKADFPAVTVGTWQVSVIRRSGSTQVPISVVINGPVAADSIVRLDQNPVVCNGAERVIVSEVDRGEDSSCTKAACETSTISGRTTVRVYDPLDVLIDTETNIEFNRPDPAALLFESTARLPLTRHLGAPANNDGILSVDHGYTIEATYADVSGATTVNRVSKAVVDCSPDLDIIEQQQIGQDFPFQLIGGCDDDNYLDENETFSFSVSFYNADPSDLLQAEIRMRACENAAGTRDPLTDGCTPVSYIEVHDNVQALGYLPAQTSQFTRFAFTVTGAPASGREIVDLDVCLAGDVTGQHIEDCVTFTMLADADDDKHFYITDCPDGCEARHDINNDEDYEESIARNDFDPLDFIRRGQSEFITYESLRTAGDEDSNGTPDCEENGNTFTCGNPGFTGPWDFDSDDDGFRTGIDTQSESSSSITNWGEDRNFNNELDLYEDANNDFFLTQNWSKNGGCGYMSNDSGAGARGGVWHTGTIGNYSSTTAACRTSESICELYDVFTSTQGTALWFEMLHTPIVHPVHFGTHPDGFDWRTQIIDWSWAQQWDQAPGAAFTWELDLNTNDDRVIPGDAFIAGGIFGLENGLVNGGQWDIFDGGLAFTDTDPVTGDERIPSKGGNREARRGCYFNDLIADDGGEFMVDRAVNYPTPWDDDCDNEISLGADGCPGLCGVDDDGNGVVDDPQELCSCKRCQGGPRDGQACFLTKFCNPETDRDFLCDFEVNTAGRPSGYGDDVCGDGATDEGVFADFGTSILHSGRGERAERNGTPELVNGIGRGGRGAGKFEFNTIEDIYGPPGDSWQGEIGFAVFEALSVYDQAYGMAVDSMVLEWMEVHPIPQVLDDVCYTTGTVPDTFEGQCAVVSLGETGNTFDGDGLITISVTDHVPSGNLADCGGGIMGVEVEVSSEAERVPEVYCLEPVEPGSPHYQGQIRTSTSVNAAGDELVYLAFNGSDTPSITANYIDKDDGINAVDAGDDGQPGIAGFDDDGDGTVDEADELCPETNVLGPGRSPHIPGQPARYSDDNCGCGENPITDSTFATFDSIDAVISDVRIADNGDGDGWADPGEELTVEFTLRNLADFPLEDIKLRLGTRSDKVECLTGDTITISALDKLGETGSEVDIANPGGVTVTGSFSFVAADVTRPGSVGTGSDFFSEFSVTLQAIGKATAGADGGGRRDTLENLDIGTVDVPIFGTSVLQTFRVVHNLDASQAGSATTWTEDFESYNTDDNMFVNWTRHNTGDDEPELDGTRCQHNDPANPFGNNTDPLNFCEVGEGFDNTANEWHLAGPNGCTSQGMPNCTSKQGAGGNIPRSFDRDVPSTGDNGDKSMMMSWHNYINLGTFDQTADYMSTRANRMRWIETANNIQLGGLDPADPAPELSYWTQMSLVDGRLFQDLDFPVAFDAARTYVCVDNNNNNECDTLETGNETGSEHWETLSAYFNPEQSFRYPNFINCMFEPSDDGDNEDMFYPGSQDLGPSSTCFPQLSDTCIGRTRTDHPQSATTGITGVTLRNGCFPETGVVDSLEPGIYEEGTGVGIWALRKYDLQQFRGRKILLRFHATPGGIPGFDFLSIQQAFGNRDDGWVIDDIEIAGARTSGFNVSVDDTGTGTPPANECPTTTCGSVTARVAVVPLFLPSDSRYKPVPVEDKTALACSDSTLEYCDFDKDGTVDASSDVAQSDAPGRKWLLDARASTADFCFGGDLQYRMELPNGTLLRDWLSDAGPAVAPLETTTYNVFVRCSSDYSCTDTVTITIEVTGAGGCDPIEGLTFNSNKVDFSWLQPTGNACPAVYDTAKGDIATLRSSGNFSAASCLNDNLPTTSDSDITEPATGAGIYYLSSADGETWNTGAASQDGDRDATLTGVCP